MLILATGVVLHQNAGFFFFIFVVLVGVYCAYQATPRGPAPFQKKSAVLGGEKSDCFRVIHQAAGGSWSLLPNVAVKDLVAIKPDAKHKKHWEGKLDGSVDFVLCNNETLEPCLAIVIGSPPSSEPKATKPPMVESLGAAGLPLMYLAKDDQLERTKVRKRIDEAMGKEKKKGK